MSPATPTFQSPHAASQGFTRPILGRLFGRHPHTPLLALVFLACSTVAYGTPLEFYLPITAPDGSRHDVIWKTIDLEQTIWTPYEPTPGGQRQWLGKLGTADVAWLNHELRVKDIPTGFFLALYSYGKPEGWLVQAGPDGSPADPNGDAMRAYLWLLGTGPGPTSPGPFRFATADPSYDLNHDGTIDAGDAGLLFGDWTGDAVPSVPEPSSLALTMLAMSLLGPTMRR